MLIGDEQRLAEDGNDLPIALGARNGSTTSAF
jgi:hypothetical protein